jgi:hypothetical protein
MRDFSKRLRAQEREAGLGYTDAEIAAMPTAELQALLDRMAAASPEAAATAAVVDAYFARITDADLDALEAGQSLSTEALTRIAGEDTDEARAGAVEFCEMIASLSRAQRNA